MTDPRIIALSSNPGQVEPGPFSEHDLREQWNAQADEFNQWDSLDSSEQLAWAQNRAITGVCFPRLEPTAFELGELPPPAAAKPVNLDELHDPYFSDGLTASQHLDVLRGGPDPRATATASPGLPPRVGHILRLAEIIREVDGKDELGAAALAEAILAHPGFSGCHDGPVDQAAQGEVGNPWQPIETAPRDGTWVLLSGGECEFNEESDNKRRAVTARWTTEFSCRNRSGRWLFAYYDSGVYGEYENPTHWQPLLSPPSTPPHA